MNSTKNIPIVFQKKKLNGPLPAFPPSLRLKEPQTKLTSLIPPERLQEISWQDFWRSHAPRGASIENTDFLSFFSHEMDLRAPSFVFKLYVR
jgi:hypothetical protein